MEGSCTYKDSDNNDNFNISDNVKNNISDNDNDSSMNAS